jgi:hypothetical protein
MNNATASERTATPTWRELLDRVEDAELDEWAQEFAKSRAESVVDTLKAIVSIAQGAIDDLDKAADDGPGYEAGAYADTVDMLRHLANEAGRCYHEASRLYYAALDENAERR